jgi:hypothetical protein
LVAVAAAGAIAATASAGFWNEEGDAIDVLPGQTTVGVGQLDWINGTLGDLEDADMFAIRIVSPGSFRATTVGGSGLDTQLFLFKQDGMGITFNDDSEKSLQSTLTSQFTASLPAGIYYLAISSYDRDPIDNIGQELWEDQPYDIERAPDGPGANNPLGLWNDTGGDTGIYSISLTGVEYATVPEPGTLLALGALTFGVLRRRRA